MSSKTTVVVEAGMQGGEVVVKALGAGARDWFSLAAWHVSEGTQLRDIVHIDDWSAVDDLKARLNNAHVPMSEAAAGGTAAGESKYLDMQLAHFESTKYVPELMAASSVGAAGVHQRQVDTVQYVSSRVKVTVFSTRGRRAAVREAGCEEVKQEEPAGKKVFFDADAESGALLVFNLPDTWQWRPDAGGAAPVVVGDTPAKSE